VPQRVTGSVPAARDTQRVKAPYRTELDRLDSTYGGALSANIEVLRETVQHLGCGPAVFAGSGGSMVLALLAARLHENICRQPARACTSLELLDLPQLEHRGALLFSSSAKHPDAQRVLASFQRGRFFPTALVTHRAADDVQTLASPDTRVVTLDELDQRDGFLATGSILQIATQMLRAYLPDPELPHSLDEDAQDADVRESVLVLCSPSLASVAADIEVRLVESGLACVQVADFRNFAHGRHTGFARRMDQTTVLVLSDRDSRDLAEATAGVLPGGADVRRWHADAAWESAIVVLLARSMRLAATMGENVGVDVARPRVPQFGRRLYNLPLQRRLVEARVGGVERKLLAAGAGDDRSLRATYEEAGAGWSSELERQRFSGLVLDYDGTVCWTRRRWALPEEQVRVALGGLLDRGLIVGFASGRGKSLHADLRKWVPTSHWPQVVVGLYNGAVRLSLNDDLGDLRSPTPWSEAVVEVIKRMPYAAKLELDERGAQVSVSVGSGVLHHGHLADSLADRLIADSVPARIVASAHSVDIVELTSGKPAVASDVERLAGGQVLAIGDQGQQGGNDQALLAGTPWSLSVDRCSSDPSRCWFAGSGDRVGPDLLVAYLRALRKRRDGFAVTGTVVT
jgi:hypothetical protein